jgi:cation transport ATPase
MSGIPGRLQQRLVDLSVYAYKALALYFLFFSVLRFIFHNGGWVNEFIVFLILSCPFAIVLAIRRMRRQ